MDLRAVIFVPALVGATIAGFLFLLFASHYYLTVMESTGAGGKEVTWFSEPILDNFWKPFYLAWLIGLWLGPAFFIGRAFASGADAGWLKLAVPLVFLWALFPISQLSSLSSSSIWVPLNLDVFGRLAQKPLVTLGFYALTLPVFALFGLAFQWSFLTAGAWDLLFVGVPLLALAVLFYARLLGRLAFGLMFTRALLARRKKKKPKKDEEAESEPDAEPEPFQQPADLPPLNAPDGELVGYNVLMSDDPPVPKKRVKAQIAEDDDDSESGTFGVIEPVPPPAPPPPPPPPARKRPHPHAEQTWTDEDEDNTPYEMNTSEILPEERIPAEVIKPRAEEMALLDRSDAPKPPKRVWTAELFVFLAQPGTISALGILSGMGIVAGLMVRIAREFNPVAGAE